MCILLEALSSHQMYCNSVLIFIWYHIAINKAVVMGTWGNYSGCG